jgi:Ca2+-binding EF-hand superfamily protein
MLASFLAAVTMVGAAAAQTPPPQGERPSREQMFAAMDADHDGVVSRAEFDAFRSPNAPDRGQGDNQRRNERRAQFFATADANADGGITLEEMRAAPMPRRPEGAPPR